jgi:hypothetical protein
MSQFVISRKNGKSYQPHGLSSIFLPNIPMTFIKSNNWYYKSHTASGRVGASCQAGNVRAVKRRT